MSIGSVYARGWVPHTCIAMTSTIRITSFDAKENSAKQIGLIQSFKPTDSRKMERARGVGYGDRVAEIVPGLTDTTITCSRMALYDKNILESFGYLAKTGTRSKGAVRSLSHMKNPFDIHEIIWFHTNDESKSTVTIYHDCWMNNWSRSIEITGNLILLEDITIDVTWVSDSQEPKPYDTTDVYDTHGLDCGPSSAGKISGPNFAAGIAGS